MATSLCKSSVMRIYQEVIDDVISGVRELFLEDGVDEQVLQELKQTWETKLTSSKAVQNEQDDKITKSDLLPANGFPKPVNNKLPVVPQQPQQSVQPQVSQIVDTTKLVPIQITLPPQAGTDGAQRVLTIQVPASALQGNALHRVLTGPVITATMGLPANIASTLLQQHVNAAFNSQQQTVTTVIQQADGADDVGDEEISIEIILPNKADKRKGSKAKKPKQSVVQSDGPMDTSDEDEDGSDDDNDDDDLDDDKDEDDQEMEDEGGEEEPLNSEDDVTDDDPTDLFDTDNIVVCQYDKIIRNRNRWKFYLKDGIMNLNGQDYVFQKANGDAEW
ncbi:hypothetical protein NQ315_011970 [Exocentrus adspersus]|uniref:Transcription initiation factor IIA subunit 1 n=1 Tax=Exocentrus adspersus TaxID=1586481 RepID=A0AAV8W1H2_9CUCU|nr:hypothetical protein NQ315_011970 [Exocentrus adspersus]